MKGSSEAARCNTGPTGFAARGTAGAVLQNIRMVEALQSDPVAAFGADQVCCMVLRQMAGVHPMPGAHGLDGHKHVFDADTLVRPPRMHNTGRLAAAFAARSTAAGPVRAGAPPFPAAASGSSPRRPATASGCGV